MPQTYFRYLRDGDFAPIERILAHNRQDIVSLAQLLCFLCGQVDCPETVESGQDLLSLARSLEKRGDTAKAVKCYRLCARGDTRAEAYHALARERRRAGDVTAAIRLYETMLRRGDDPVSACEALAKLYEHRLHNPAQALTTRARRCFFCRNPAFSLGGCTSPPSCVTIPLCAFTAQALRPMRHINQKGGTVLMGIMTIFKARSAASKLSKGDTEGAMRLYKEAIDEGLQDVRYILTYVVLLIRAGRYQEARDLLVKIQRYPMADNLRCQLYVDYASCVYKMGELQKGIELLERQHAKQPSGLVYETLGYLYVEAGDYEKALAFNTEAYDYDDEDSITLDNLAQTYYRLGNDKAKAREFFQKAIELKPTQIDTLYFLAQYDIEEGNKDAAREKLEKALKGRFSPLNYATREMVQASLDSL